MSSMSNTEAQNRWSKKSTRASRKIPDALISSPDDTDDSEDVCILKKKADRNSTNYTEFSDPLKTPKSNKSISKRKSTLRLKDENKLMGDFEESPPKQQKFEKSAVGLFSPSCLLNRLSIEENKDDISKRDEDKRQKRRTKYQNARRVLNSAETTVLPCREKELEDLETFLADHVDNRKSGSLYVSGPPGTGKTACLSKILKSEYVSKKFTTLYINCTSMPTIGGIYKKICSELNLKLSGKTEKDYLLAIEKYLKGNQKMLLLVLDEVDQLVGQKQSVLYTIFEWPAKHATNLLLIGIANSLDLTDRLLTRLNAKCMLKPKLMQFRPYTKQQLVEIFKSRLEEAGVSDVFPAITLQLLAAKVSAVSGDVRRALDIGRRVVEIAEHEKSETRKLAISEIVNEEENYCKPLEENELQPVQAKQVVSVLNEVYGASQTLNEDIEDAFPIQQKILICSLMLMIKKEKNKDITIGRLHEVYKRVCSKRNLSGVDQAEFVSLCHLVETRGIIRVMKKKEPRQSKVLLQWDEDEVHGALKDKQLIATILDDAACLSR